MKSPPKYQYKKEEKRYQYIYVSTQTIHQKLFYNALRRAFIQHDRREDKMVKFT